MRTAHRSVFLLLLRAFVFVPLLALARAQTPTPAPSARPTANPASAPAPLEARVPAYANPSCPIMGKPISERLFTDTARGRIYICCKSCIKDVLADVDAAYKSAFPHDVEHANERCPLTGAELGKDAPRVVLQGHSFRVRDAATAEVARKDVQLALVKLLEPALVDLANKTCPVTGEPVAPNTLVVIDGHLVRLASKKAIEQAQLEPAKVLARAKELRASGGAAK